MSVPYPGFSPDHCIAYPLPTGDFFLVNGQYYNYCFYSNIELSKANAELQEENQRLREENKSLKAGHTDMLEALQAEKDAEIERLLDVNEELEKNIKHVEKHNLDLLDKENDYLKHIEKLKASIGKKDSEESKKDAVIAEKETLIAALAAKDVAHLEENAQIKKHNAELESRIGKQEIQHSHMVAQLKKEIESLQREHDESVAADVQKIAGDLMKTQVEPLSRKLNESDSTINAIEQENKSLKEEKDALLKINKSLESDCDKRKKEADTARELAKSMLKARAETEKCLKVAEPIIGDLFKMLSDAIAVSIKGLEYENMNSDQRKLLGYEAKASEDAKTIGEKAGMPNVDINYRKMIEQSIRDEMDLLTAAFEKAGRVNDDQSVLHTLAGRVNDDQSVLHTLASSVEEVYAAEADFQIPKRRRAKKEAVRMTQDPDDRVAARTPAPSTPNEDDIPLLNLARREDQMPPLDATPR